MAYAAPKQEQHGLCKILLDKHTPATWSPMPPGREFLLVDLSAETQEYIDVLSKIKATMPTILVTGIQRIQNPYLWGAFLLKKAENALLREEILFHATPSINVMSIVSNNYDWRRTMRTNYGQGVNFSTRANFADQACNLPERAMLLNRVLVGKSFPGSHRELPDNGFDTTTGNLGQVYVKYSDNEFYPEYVAYYSKSYLLGAYMPLNYFFRYRY